MKHDLYSACWRLAAIIFALCSMAGLGCTHSSTSKTANTEALNSLQTSDIIATKLPPINQLAPRYTSGIANIAPNVAAKDKKSGNDMKSAGGTLASPLNVATKTGELQWVIYSYGPCGSANKPVDITLNLTGTTGPVWVAFANYSTNIWEWQMLDKGTFASENIIYNTKNQYYNSANGACYVAIAAYNGCNLKFAGATVNSSGDFPSGPAIVQPINWSFHFIEEGDSVGTFNRVVMLNNVPAIVYNDTSKNQVKYAYGIEENPKSSTEWTKMAIEGSKSDKRGGYLDISQWKGYPMVIYEATTDQRVWFAYSKKQSPVSNADWVIYQPYANGRAFPQVIANTTGPAFMMIDLSAAIKYAHSKTADIPTNVTEWDIDETVYKSSGAFFETPCGAIFNDKPICAYQQKKDGFNELRISQYNAPADWTSYTIDSIDITPDQKNAGLSPMIATWKSGIAIAYGNKPSVGNQTLQYAYTTEANPSSSADWKRHQVSAVDKADTGKDLGFAFYLGNPVLCYNNGDSALHIAVAKTSTPTSDTDWDFGILEQATIGYSINGSCSPIELADGSLGVVYRTGQGLKFALFTP